MSHVDVDYDDILLLLRLGDEAGGRVDPARLRARGAGSTSRRAFEAATALGYLDSDGWITDEGAVALGGRKGSVDDKTRAKQYRPGYGDRLRARATRGDSGARADDA